MSPLLTTPLRWWSLTWPRLVDLDEVLAGLRQVAGSRRVPLVLRAEGRAGVVRYYLGAGHDQAARVLAGSVAGLKPVVVPEPVLDGPVTAVSLRFSTRNRTVAISDGPRVSAGVITAMAAAGPADMVVLEWALLDVLAPATVPYQERVAVVDGGPVAALSSLWRAPGRPDAEARRAASAKRAEPGWRAVGRLAVSAAVEGRRRQLLSGVVAALRAAESPGLRLRVRTMCPGSLGQAGVWTRRPVALDVLEVPVVAGWPSGGLRGSAVVHARYRELDADAAMPRFDPNRSQRLVAVGTRHGEQRAMVLSARDGLRHLHVVGPTGSGKSTLLVGLIEADMAAGRSLLVFDPKGDLLADVLARVSAGRRSDVVVLDPSETVPVGFNPLAGSGEPELVAEGLLGTLHELFASSWGPRTHDILSASLHTLAGRPNSSLALVPLLLTNARFRQQVTAGLDDPLGLGGFWDWYEALSDGERAAAIGPVLNKLRQLLLRPALRGVLGQANPRFDLKELFTTRRIVLVNLSAGTLGPEASALFGALVWSRLWQLTQARAGVPPRRRHPVTVVADEFQDYLKTPVSFTDVLVRARGLGVGVVMAHQHLGQLGAEVREAVLANAGSRVVFGLGAKDAAVVAGLGDDLTPEDLRGLGPYEVYADLRIDGRATGWMSGRTMPPSRPLVDPETVRATSRERYGVPRADTEAELRSLVLGRTGDGGFDGPVGIRRRGDRS